MQPIEPDVLLQRLRAINLAPQDTDWTHVVERLADGYRMATGSRSGLTP